MAQMKLNILTFFLLAIFSIVIIAYFSYFYGFNKGIAKVSPPEFSSDSYVLDLDEGKILDSVNDVRKDLGIPTLTLNSNLCSYANNRALYIKLSGNFNHDTFRRDMPSLFTTFYGVGENLARGILSESMVVPGWLGSPPHKALLYDPAYTLGCIGTYQDVVVLEVAIPY